MAKYKYILVGGVLAVGLVWFTLPSILHWTARSGVVPPPLRIIAGVAAASTFNATQVLYGRIVDQDGKPVTGADVTLGFSQFKDGEMYVDHGPGMTEFHLTTDADGRFTVNQKGWLLELRKVEKSGYRFDPETGPHNWAFKDNPPTPPVGDPAHPLEFKAWRNGVSPDPLWNLSKDRLFRGTIKFPDSFAVYLIATADTPKPCVVSGHPPDADLWIKLDRSEIRRFQQGWAYDWSMEIEVPHGGLIADNDAHPYQAPGDGYSSRFSLPMVSSKPGWNMEVNQGFYVRLRDGKAFGHILVHAMITTNGDFALSGFINLDGSRNLQPGGGFLNR